MSMSSLDDEEGCMEDEMMYGEDEFMSYSASAVQAAHAEESSRRSKGKGKEGEAADAGSKDDSSIYDKLRRIQSIDDRTVSALVADDPTPLGSLSTSAKLMRALVSLQDLFAPEILEATRQPISTSTLPSPSPRSLPLATFTTIIELLSSALADVNQPSPPSRHTYELNAARAQLALRQSGYEVAPSVPPPPSSSSLHRTPSEKDDRTLAELMADNARLMILQLRPPLLDSPPPTSPTFPADLIRPKDLSTTPIGHLPPEILARIFEIARHEAEQPVLTGDLGHRYDDFGVLRTSRVPARPQPGQQFELSGSRTLAQRFAHSLALVCKDWKLIARTVAFSAVHLSRRTQLDKLLELLASSDNSLASHIRTLNAKVPAEQPDVDAMGDTRGTSLRRGGAFVLPLFRGQTTAWNGAGPANERGKGSDDAAETQGALFQRLVLVSTNLKSLSLTVLGHAFSQSPFAGRHAGADFLDPVILATLSSIPTLRTLTLGTSIDFEELEVIMLGLPLLEELRLDGGFDSIDGRGAVSSTSPHQARLRKLTVGDGQQVPRDFSSVSDVQLAWLLEPAATTLHVLDMTVMSMNPNGGFGAGGWGGGGGGGAQAPPFASGLFADLLVRMGPTLERLAIKDAQGGGALSPSLNNAPHNGNLDHALSFCTSLRELVVQFQYTGAALLDSLRASPSLESLFFLGPPTGTGAAELARRIEGGDQFARLQRVIVSGQFGGRGVLGGGGWLGADVRRLKSVCAEAKVYCLVASS